MTTAPTESMEISIRRRRLRDWIDTRFNGSQAAFLEDCSKRGHDLNQGELSGLLKQKSFGEKKARKIEAMAGMPPFHLNTGQREFSTAGYTAREPDPVQEYLWPFKAVSAWDYRNTLTPADREAVDSMVTALYTARQQSSKHPQPENNTSATGAAT